MKLEGLGIGATHDFGDVDFRFENNSGVDGVHGDKKTEEDTGIFEFGDSKVRVNTVTHEVTLTDDEGQFKTYVYSGNGGWRLIQNTDDNNSIHDTLKSGEENYVTTVHVDGRTFSLNAVSDKEFFVDTYVSIQDVYMRGTGDPHQQLRLDIKRDGQMVVDEYVRNGSSQIEDKRASFEARPEGWVDDKFMSAKNPFSGDFWSPANLNPSNADGKDDGWLNWF